MISTIRLVRYALATVCGALPIGHAIATGNYIQVYTSPTLIVDQGGVRNNWIVSTWDNAGQGTVTYFAGNNNEIAVFTETGAELNGISSESGSFCYGQAIAFPPPPYLGFSATTVSQAFPCVTIGGLPSFDHTYTFKSEGKPVTRIRTTDGSSFDALPLVVTRDGTPWQTYYFGYKMGLAAKTFDYSFEATDSLNIQYEFLRADDFKLAILPPPLVEGMIVEYLNASDFPLSPGGHYFYSADPLEQASVDSGGAGAFYRTGRSFKAGGYVSVCRFYGSQQPGPNSHFFTVDQSECEFLKSVQKIPMPSTEQQWNYEGQGFHANAPIPPPTPGGTPSCPTGSIPVYRAYNNAWDGGGKRPWDSNHRYSTDLSDIQEVVARYGWNNEGVVMCAPN